MACCGTGFSAGKFIAAIVAVGVGGFVAFNYATNGSFCSSCDKSKDAVVQPTAAGAQADCAMGDACDDACKEACEGGACPMSGACETDKAAGACEADKAACPMTGAHVEEAANTAGADSACQHKCSGEECDPAGCEGKEGCPDKGACPSKQADEVATNETEKSAG